MYREAGCPAGSELKLSWRPFLWAAKYDMILIRVLDKKRDFLISFTKPKNNVKDFCDSVPTSTARGKKK